MNNQYIYVPLDMRWEYSINSEWITLGVTSMETDFSPHFPSWLLIAAAGTGTCWVVVTAECVGVLFTLEQTIIIAAVFTF